MNIENLFTILLHTLTHQIIKLIISNINNINNNYLWKLLYIRKYQANNTLSPYNLYILHHNLINLNIKMNLKIHIYKYILQLINLQEFIIHNNKLQSIPTEIGQLINL